MEPATPPPSPPTGASCGQDDVFVHDRRFNPAAAVDLALARTATPDPVPRGQTLSRLLAALAAFPAPSGGLPQRPAAQRGPVSAGRSPS